MSNLKLVFISVDFSLSSHVFHYFLRGNDSEMVRK